MYSKPSWLPQKVFHEFLKVHSRIDGTMSCAWCHKIIDPNGNDFSVDHIVPQDRGGEHNLSNLQPAHGRCNSSKGTKPDKYWSRDFYWDQSLPIGKGVLRSAQENVYWSTLNTKDWFSKNFDQINKVLYIIAGVTGMGKTIAMPVLACALNQIKNEERVGQPRVDKFLILTKEIGLREQLYLELKEELVKFSIFSEPPRIGVVRKGYQWQTSFLNNKDIVISCEHQLWETDRKRDWDETGTLAQFPLIFVDESHFADRQVQAIVGKAHRSLVFGLTATPIDRSGNIHDGCVLHSLYSYNDVHVNDHCLKYVGKESVTILKTKETDIKLEGIDVTIQDGDKIPGYEKNIKPILSVVMEGISKQKSRDEETKTKRYRNPLARHRINKIYKDGIDFPSHMMVKCENIEIARIMRSITQDILEAKREMYPLDEGWNSSAAHSKSEKYKSERLDEDHPFLRYKKNEGKLDDRCARILFLVDMGTEGLNNPYCVDYAICCSLGSLPLTVQAPVGRPVRSPMKKDNGFIIVPRESLDTVSIITHEVFNNEAILNDAIDYVLDMNSWFSSMTTVYDLMSNQDVSVGSSLDTTVPPLDDTKKIDICSQYGDALKRHTDYDIEDIIISDNVNPDSKKAERYREFDNILQSNLKKVSSSLSLTSDLQKYPIITRDVSLDEKDEEALLEFIYLQRPEIYDIINNLLLSDKENAIDLMSALYERHQKDFSLRNLKPLVDEKGEEITIRTVQIRITSEIINDFSSVPMRKGVTSQSFDGVVYSIVMNAMKDSITGYPDEVFSHGSAYDIPEVHILLLQHGIKRQIKGYVRNQIINHRMNFFPSLSELFRRRR